MSFDSSDKTTADPGERRGQMVTFPSNGSSGSGYFAPSVSGSGPGVLVIQEWWGLVPHIMNVVDRYAEAGFSALAPDLYRGETTTEPDEAGKLMMALNLPQAVKDMSGAINYLVESEAVSSAGVGVTGFCMGGGLALVIAATAPEHIQACAPYYGLIPWPDAAPDWSRLAAPVHGHYAEKDGFFTAELATAFREELLGLGKEVELTIHPGVEHAFFNDDRPEVYDAATAEECWRETTEFFRSVVR